MRISAILLAAVLVAGGSQPSTAVGQDEFVSLSTGDIDDVARSSYYCEPRFPAFFSSSCQPSRMSRALYRYQLRQIRLAQEQIARQAKVEANRARYERVRTLIEARELRWWGVDRRVFARLDSMNTHRVVLVEEDGRRQELPLPELSMHDQDYIREVKRGWR